MSSLREAFDEFVADVPVYGDLDRAIDQAKRERRHRQGAIACLAAVALVTVIVGGLAASHHETDSPQPIGPSPTPTRTTKHAAFDLHLRNGQVTSASRYLGADAPDYAWRSFDPLSETGLFVTGSHGRRELEPVEGLEVVGQSGTIATLTCAQDLQCSPEESWLSYAATLGPAPDEVTVESGDGAVQVIGYDGAVRRTIDLTATTTGGGEVRGLRWSADGSRLAVVTTRPYPSAAAVSEVWLADREGANAQLAYSLIFDETGPITRDASDFDGKGAVWTSSNWGWSPDGQSLLLDVRTLGSYGADAILLHLQPDGAVQRVIVQKLHHSGRNFDSAGNVTWSPDGTLIAVRHEVFVVEISAVDGSVIARRPPDPGWLIWPAR